MSSFEQDYFEKILLPSIKTVPFNYDAALRSLLEQAFTGRKKISLLDYGCGTGHFVNYTLEHGIDAWGVDISDYSRTISVVQARHGVLVEGKVPAGFGLSHYDLCFCCGVLQYMEEAELRSFLRYIPSLCDKIWIETLTDCSNEIPAMNDSYNKPLRTRLWYNKIFSNTGFKVARVTPVYYKNAWLLERFKK